MYGQQPDFMLYMRQAKLQKPHASSKEINLDTKYENLNYKNDYGKKHFTHRMHYNFTVCILF